jgi:hypothetical protein
MNGRTDIDRALDGFFADGPERVADQAFLRALDAVDRTKQRHDLFAPWRFSLMSINSRLATMMLVAVVAVGGVAFLAGQRSGVGGPIVPSTAPISTPTLAPTIAPATPAPTQVSTVGWIPFTSAIYGFSAARPISWSVGAATGHSATTPGGDANPDTFWSPSGWPAFTGQETQIPAGKTAAAFLQEVTADGVQTACYPLPSTWAAITIDGHPASIGYGGCNEHFYGVTAVAVIGKRIWFFHLDGPDRSLIVPFLTTVKIDPTKVVD